MPAQTATGLGHINLITVPTLDIDAAIDFYVSQLGFEKRTDIPFGGSYRWVEVYPPAGGAGIALCPPRPGTEGDHQPRDTGVIIAAADADASHAALRDAGVDVDPEVSRMGDPIPPMFWLRDPERNVLMVAETPAS